jgi:hypothetical protein
MIEIVEHGAEAVMEVRATGRVTEHDYESVLIPAIEAALSGGAPVRLLFQIGPGFEGYSAGAIWADARLGMRHWRGFDRVAVVTDSDAIENAIKILGFAMPCPVRTFELEEGDEARRWLKESLGSIQLEEIGEGALTVRLLGKVDSSAYANKSEELDAYVNQHGRFRLLLDLRKFDGWQGLGAIGDHLTLVRNHYRAPTRVAVVGDQAWMKMARAVMASFLDARTCYFETDDFDGAKAWLLA